MTIHQRDDRIFRQIARHTHYINRIHEHSRANDTQYLSTCVSQRNGERKNVWCSGKNFGSTRRGNGNGARLDRTVHKFTRIGGQARGVGEQ